MKRILSGLLIVLAAGFASSAAADMTIAVVGPMTGKYATFGQQMRRGAEMAVADLNAAGGVRGKPIELVLGDDACDPRQAREVANKMASKGVVLVVGHFCSGSSIPASEVYAEEGILQISPGSTNPQLTERGFDNVFRTCGRDDQQGIVAGNYIADHFAHKRVAILHDKTAYGKGLADETRKQLHERGQWEALYEAFSAGDQDYSALVSKMKAAGIGVIYVGGYHTEAGLIVRQARQQGLQAVLMAGDALVTDEYWGITGDAGEGTLMTFSPDPTRNAAARPVVERFLAQGQTPEGYVLYTYGAIQAFAQAAEKARSTKVPQLVKTLKSEQFDTVLGTIGFDRKGDVTAPGYVVYAWRDGRYDYVDN